MCPRIFKKNVSIIAPIRALSKYFCTFLDWPDFHFVEYWFLLWMPFKKLWDLDSNYFFALTTMQKDSDRQCQEWQNASKSTCHVMAQVVQICWLWIKLFGATVIAWPFANLHLCFAFDKKKGPQRRDGQVAANAHRCKRLRAAIRPVLSRAPNLSYPSSLWFSYALFLFRSRFSWFIGIILNSYQSLYILYTSLYVGFDCEVLWCCFYFLVDCDDKDFINF